MHTVLIWKEETERALSSECHLLLQDFGTKGRREPFTT